jgi:hypothetical protein
MAVTVIDSMVVTCGALSNPEEEMDPAVVLQVTVVLKLPVPLTFAEHWLVPPDVMVGGKQLTLTPVMLEAVDPPPFPPQAASHITQTTASNKLTLRAMMSLS